MTMLPRQLLDINHCSVFGPILKLLSSGSTFSLVLGRPRSTVLSPKAPEGIIRTKRADNLKEQDQHDKTSRRRNQLQTVEIFVRQREEQDGNTDGESESKSNMSWNALIGDLSEGVAQIDDSRAGQRDRDASAIIPAQSARSFLFTTAGVRFEQFLRICVASIMGEHNLGLSGAGEDVRHYEGQVYTEPDHGRCNMTSDRVHM